MVRYCPICGNHRVGLIGINRYFCAECCHEFISSGKRQEAFYPGENGDIRRAGTLNDLRGRRLSHA